MTKLIQEKWQNKTVGTNIIDVQAQEIGEMNKINLIVMKYFKHVCKLFMTIDW